jgi:hypothetical protein
LIPGLHKMRVYLTSMRDLEGSRFARVELEI